MIFDYYRGELLEKWKILNVNADVSATRSSAGEEEVRKLPKQKAQIIALLQSPSLDTTQCIVCIQ